MSNKTYDLLKYIVQFALPALAGLYTTIAGIWGLPYQTEVPNTCLALAAFGATCLGISNAAYVRRGDSAK